MSISFIKKIYEEKKLPLSEQEDYECVLGVIEEKGVSPQAYYLLKEKGMLEETPMFFQKRLKVQYQQCLFLNLYIKSQQTRILECFEENGVEVIPLKGPLFSEKYYEDLGARPTSDIDLLIREQDLPEAVRIVESLGFCMEQNQVKNHFHLSLSKNITGSAVPLTVELHWDLVWQRTASLNIDDFWNQAFQMDGNSYVKELSGFHTFYFICLHGWRHNMNSPKYFLDIIQVAERLGDNFDLYELFAVAKKDKTLKRLIRTLSIVIYHFPNLDLFKSLSSKRMNLWWYAQPIIKETHPNKWKRGMDYLDYQFLSFDTVGHSLREIVNWVGTGFGRNTGKK